WTRGLTASATTAATAGSTRAPLLRKRLLLVANVLGLHPLRRSTRGLPTITPSNGFLRTTARRQLLRLLAPTPQSILRTCRRSNAALLPRQETRSWTRNTRRS